MTDTIPLGFEPASSIAAYLEARRVLHAVLRQEDPGEIAMIDGKPLTVEDLRRLLTKFEERRIELRDARNDLLNIRGILSPADGPRAVPPAVQMVPNAAPAVEWLVNDRDMFRDRWHAAAQTADKWRKYALEHRDEPNPAEQAAWRAMAHALCCVISALDGDETVTITGRPEAIESVMRNIGDAAVATAEVQEAAPAPPPGSYWTDPDGKVWDLSCQYLDRHHRLWRVTHATSDVPMMVCIQTPGVWYPLARVEAEFGPLTRIPPKVEPEATHYGNGTHGGPAQHKGKRENCPAPECNDAIADEREERDEETRQVRALLAAVEQFMSRYAISDADACARLTVPVTIAYEQVSALFDSRIADLDHRAAQLPDGGLATKP